MATRTYITHICDICGKDEADNFRIAFKPKGQPRSIDLCPVHARPLRKLEESVGKRKAD